MEIAAYFRYLAALLVVLGLIGVLAWLARRFRIAGMAAPRGAGRRLAVVEVATLDPRRRLVLVRRDGVEHLLLLGQEGSLVVEAGISGADAPVPADDDAGEPR